MELIDKDALIAEIERRKNNAGMGYSDFADGCYETCKELLLFLDTLEAKETEEKFECPNIKIKDTIEVSSRMKYIDEDLKPIADFIMDYASWDLQKDEWNQPTLTVPLFRVLDALIQRGKPYCEG